MKVRAVCLIALTFWSTAAYGGVVYVDLGLAGSFGVLAGTSVTNTGSTDIAGDVGVSPGSAITGFPPGIIGGTEYVGGDAALAEAALSAAYTFASDETGGSNLTGEDLGGLTLTSGVYDFSISAALTGTLTLNGQGDPNAVFVFQIASALTTASASSVALENGAQGDNVFWQVGTSATLGTTTAFEGNILADTSITLDTGASIACGSALAAGGAVTLDSNSIGTGSCSQGGEVPEPETHALLGGGLALLLIGRRRQSRKPV